MLLPVVATALGLGLAAPFSLALAWRVPFGLLPTRTVLRSSLVTSLGTFLIGAIVEGCAAATGPTEGVLGAIIGGTFMATLTWLRARRSHRTRGTLLLAMRLTEPPTRERAREVLDRNLARMRPRGDEGWGEYVDLVLLVVAAASQAELFTYAAEHLARLPSDLLDPRRRALVAQALATCRVRLGQLDRARQILEETERPAPDEEVERWMRTLEALVAALCGRPEAALRTLDETEEDAADPPLVASRHLVRAHACAAMEREDDARAALRALREVLGPDGLAQATSPNGPASGLAQQMADGSD